METLGSSETLLEASGSPQTLETPGDSLNAPSPIRRREPRSRVSRLGPPPESPGAKSRERRVSRASARLTGEVGAETLVPGEVQPARELGLVPSPWKPNGKSSQVGDLVWVKIKNQPWWPGVVCEPSQAADRASEAGHHVLVAFFGSNSLAWCRPTQLKPFEEDFDQMAKQSGSKSFVGAVKDAVDWVRCCLESEMTCYCSPLRSQRQVGKVSITNYSPEEFLLHLQVAASDIWAADMLEATMLRSWVWAFFGRKDGSSFHGIDMELVDKEASLNVPPLKGCTAEKPKEEQGVTGLRVVKGPEIMEGESTQRKKKRSMAELIGVTDVGMVEPKKAKEEKVADPDKKPDSVSSGKRRRGRSRNDFVMGIGLMVAEEGIGLSRRERRKSKYLSPPYTYLSGYGKHSGSSTDTELGMPKDLDGSEEMIHQEEDEMSPGLLEYVGTPANVILSQFLAAASNPLNLKWNSTAETVMGFFAKFRSMVCSGELELEIYQKQLGGSGIVDANLLYNEIADVSKEGKSSNKLMVGTNGDAAVGLGGVSNNKSSNAQQTRRKLRMEQVGTGGTPPTSAPGILDGPGVKSGRKGRKGQDGGSGGVEVDLGHKVIGCLEEGKSRQKRNRSGGEVNGESFGDMKHLGQEIVNCAGLSEMRQRRKNSNGGVTNGPEEGRSRQRRKREGDISSQPVTSPPLPYVRENLERMISSLTGSPLPEKDAASVDALKPEVRENLVGDMKGLLNKVNKLLA